MPAQPIPFSSAGLVMQSCIQQIATGTGFSVPDNTGRPANPDIGWGNVNQKASCPHLHGLSHLRSRIVKHPLPAAFGNLRHPARGRHKTRLMAAHVHAACPPEHARQVRQAGFVTTVITRGIVGGDMPTTKQPAGLFCYHDAGEKFPLHRDPRSMGTDQATRAVPLSEVTPTGVRSATAPPPRLARTSIRNRH
jgi:hypothetical protein